MANNFKVWVDDINLSGNVQDSDIFAEDSQRETGFQAGVAASALRVNTALRQANLVTTALMGLVNDDNLDLKSSVTDVATGIDTWLSDKITNTTVINVSEKINGHDISDIFEENGETVKNATNTTKINNLEIKENNHVLTVETEIISKKKVILDAWYYSINIGGISPKEIEGVVSKDNTLYEYHISDASKDFYVILRSYGSVTYIKDMGWYPETSVPYYTFSEIHVSARNGKFYAYSYKSDLLLNSSRAEKSAVNLYLRGIYEIIE